MEKLKITKDDPEYNFHVGDEYVVKRNILGECIIMIPDERSNLIWSERKVRSYGNLSGKPELYFK